MTKSEKFEGMLKFWIIGFALVGLLGWSLGRTYPGNKGVEQSKPNGYPASEDEIVSGKFYQCYAAMMDMHPFRTNCFVVLQEMTPNGALWRMVETEKRLFSVKNSLQTGIVYQAERKEGVLALVPKATLPPPPKVGTIL